MKIHTNDNMMKFTHIMLIYGPMYFKPEYIVQKVNV